VNLVLVHMHPEAVAFAAPPLGAPAGGVLEAKNDIDPFAASWAVDLDDQRHFHGRELRSATQQRCDELRRNQKIGGTLTGAGSMAPEGDSMRRLGPSCTLSPVGLFASGVSLIGTLIQPRSVRF
jgi:hypothetical protein